MLYLIRHGQTDVNRDKRLQGRMDAPLNEKGLEQSAEAGRLLHHAGIAFDMVYSSPLIRAVQTAKEITDADIITDDRLLEMDYGPYEGMDLRNPAPEITAFFSDFAHTPAPAGMEQLADVTERLGSFLEEILPEAETKNILVSTHAIALKGALEYLMPESQGSWWPRFIGNCAVFAVKAENGAYGKPEELTFTE